MKVEITEETLLEGIAKLEHEQWQEWSRNISATEKISPKRLRKWEKQWCHYSVLSEKQKEKDRVYARKVIELIKQLSETK